VRYREIQPRGPAAEFIEGIWTLQCPREEAGTVQRVLPDGTAELILNLEDPLESFHNGTWRRQPRSFLAGQITGPLLLRQSGPARMLGVRFAAHGAGRLLGPMMETTGSMVPLGDLSPSLANCLEAACDAPYEQEQVTRLESCLARYDRQHGRRDLVVEEAVRRIATADSGVDLAVLARDLGVSLRQLQRRFGRAVGLGPKHFARMRRFQKIFPLVERGGEGWAAAAADCGYYDQAHLIRDCHEFAGNAPSALLASGDLARHFLRAAQGSVAFFQYAGGRRS